MHNKRFIDNILSLFGNSMPLNLEIIVKYITKTYKKYKVIYLLKSISNTNKINLIIKINLIRK